MNEVGKVCDRYTVKYHIIISYCTFLRRQFKNTGAAAINQTRRFSAVLQMYLGTVSGHECRLASCSRRVGRRRQMICHIVQKWWVGKEFGKRGRKERERSEGGGKWREKGGKGREG